MSTQLSWMEWSRWIHVLVWPAAAWGALRIVTGWGYRPLPVRQDRLGAFAGWLALTGCFGGVTRAITVLLGSGAVLMMMLADLSNPSSGESSGESWFFISWYLVNLVVLGTAFWTGWWLVRRIDWERVGGNAALDVLKPPALAWQHVYLSITVAHAFLWPLSAVSQLFGSAMVGDGLMVAALYLVSLALAARLAGGLVDDLLASKLMAASPAPTAPRLRQVLWVGAVGLLSTGISAIPNAILAVLPFSADMDPATPSASIWQAYLWIELALLVGLSILMLRLLPKHHPESGPRHAFRGIRRIAIAMALAGAMMFMQAGCVACHQIQGQFINFAVRHLKKMVPEFRLPLDRGRTVTRFNMALADFIGDNDYVGAFAVTAGHRIEERVAAFEAAHDDYSAIMLKSLADRLAEAAAEWLHLQIRTQYWGYASDEAFTNAELIGEQYQGIRPAPGYPACPDHTAKRELFALLDAPGNAGMQLTESCAMTPAAAVSGFYIAHPASSYFAIPKVGRDQLEDWATRKGFSIKEAEYWLAPLL